MKNNIFLKLVFALSIVTFIGCNGNQQNTTDEPANSVENANASTIDYSGVYISGKTGEGCNLTITLAKENETYKYFLTGEHHDQEGIAIIEKTDAVYITFDGPIGNHKPKTVSGQIEGNTIKIQNYGNSMNEYHFFVDCDEKYLEFVK